MMRPKTAFLHAVCLAILVGGASLALLHDASASISTRNAWMLDPLEDSYIGSVNWPKEYNYMLTITASSNSTAFFYLMENVTNNILLNVTLTTTLTNYTYETKGPKSFFLRLSNPSPTATANVTWDIDTDFDSGDDIPGYEHAIIAGSIILCTAWLDRKSVV